MPTTTETRVNDLIINKMSRAQFDALQEKSPTELYIVEGDSNAIYAEQITVLPTAAEGNLGKVYQYIGVTDANYTQNYFYKCVSSGSPAVYSWQQVDVQPAVDPLPDQTGQSGKFLTTDGTDASWSDKPIVNKSTSLASIAVAPNNNTVNNASFGVSFGNDAKAASECSVSIGYSAGRLNNSNAKYGVCIGYNNAVTAIGAYQFGSGTNSEAGTVCFALNTDGNNAHWTNYKVLDSDGTIPEARLADTTSATEGQVLQLDSNSNAVWETPVVATFRVWGANE